MNFYKNLKGFLGTTHVSTRKLFYIRRKKSFHVVTWELNNVEIQQAFLYFGTKEKSTLNSNFTLEPTSLLRKFKI